MLAGGGVPEQETVAWPGLGVAVGVPAIGDVEFAGLADGLADGFAAEGEAATIGPVATVALADPPLPEQAVAVERKIVATASHRRLFIRHSERRSRRFRYLLRDCDSPPGSAWGTADLPAWAGR